MHTDIHCCHWRRLTMITLYHCQDARSFRCLWALEEMQLAYQLKPLAFPPRLHAPDFLQINPTGTVPLLIDGDQVLFESAAILEYLACRPGRGSLAMTCDDPHYGAWPNRLHFSTRSRRVGQSVVRTCKIG